MAARNCEDYVAAAIDSICNQTLSDWELIIVDDASTDQTATIIQQIAETDSRISLLQNDENQGLAASLNTAMQHAKGEFLARMDADDIARPERFQAQVSYLHRHPECVLVGTQAARIDEQGAPLGLTDLPTADAQIRAQCLFENPFVHPTVMIRRDTLVQHKILYDPAFKTTQDWDLWTRILPFGAVANLSTPYLEHRQHGRSTSSTKRDLQRRNSLAVQKKYLGSVAPDLQFVEAKFALVSDVLLGDRRESQAAGVDRVSAALDSLDWADQIERNCREDFVPEIPAFILRRSIQICLFPPVARGSLKLAARLVLKRPVQTVVQAWRLIAKWVSR